MLAPWSHLIGGILDQLLSVSNTPPVPPWHHMVISCYQNMCPPLSCILCPQGLTTVTMAMPHLQTSQPIPMAEEVTVSFSDVAGVVIKQFPQTTGH